MISPKTSDESQFHQPPHDPSWTAHQDPKYNVIVNIKFIVIRQFKTDL